MGSSFESWQQSGTRCSYEGLASKRNVVSQPPFSRGAIFGFMGRASIPSVFQKPSKYLGFGGVLEFKHRSSQASANGRELAEGI